MCVYVCVREYYICSIRNNNVAKHVCLTKHIVVTTNIVVFHLQSLFSRWPSSPTISLLFCPIGFAVNLALAHSDKTMRSVRLDPERCLRFRY